MDNLLERRWSRNAVLVQGLVELEIIEQLGFGLDRMVAAMRRARLPAPEFKEIGDTFVVTLIGARAQMLAPQRPRPEPAARALSQEERQAWLLTHLRTVGPLRPRDYVAALGIERRTAIRDLQALVDQGLVEAQGTTKDRRYSLRHTP